MKKSVLMLTLLIITCLSIGSVVALHFYSADTISYRNRLNRLYPMYLEEDSVLDLHYDSYYFAGCYNSKIYLGNYTGPLTLTVIDTALTLAEARKIILADTFRFRAPQVRIFKDNFYFIDGTLPVLFKGKIINLIAKKQDFQSPAFFRYVIIDSTTIAYNFIDNASGERKIGTCQWGTKPLVTNNPAFLEKQVDGLFDSDGHLMWDEKAGNVVFLYRYRNQYTIASPRFEILRRGTTIDTISKAKVKTQHLEDQDIVKLANRPPTVNRNSFSNNNYLFVQSAIPGENEPREMWDKASIIDIYNLQDQSYKASFYVYHRGKNKLRSFVVTEGLFVGLIGNEIVTYRIKELL